MIGIFFWQKKDPAHLNYEEIKSLFQGLCEKKIYQEILDDIESKCCRHVVRRLDLYARRARICVTSLCLFAVNVAVAVNVLNNKHLV